MEDRIFLLSYDEARELPLKYLDCGKRWWLRTGGESYIRAMVVEDNGAIDEEGYCIVFGDGKETKAYVRPALTVDNIDRLPKTKRGYVGYLGVEWIDVSQYLGKNILLARNPIGHWAYNNKYNDYDISKVRRSLFEWLENRDIPWAK